jgi:hypothetical protein
MFFQKYASQQHSDGWIERRNNDGFIEPPGLAGSNEKDGAEGIDTAGE